MKLRDFFKVLTLIPFVAKAITKSPIHLVPPIREFPPEQEVIGFWVQSWNYDTKNWTECPYLVIREFDEDRDNPYQGNDLRNFRRNKYWGRPMAGGPEVLLCFDRWDHNIRFFRNAPNTDWSLIGQGILW